MPAKKLLDKSSIGTDSSTGLSDSKKIQIGERTNDVVVVAEGKIDSNASSDVTIHIRNSYDGSNFDTEDIDSFDIPVSSAGGSLVQKSNKINNAYHFLKVVAENKDTTYSATDVVVRVDTK